MESSTAPLARKLGQYLDLVPADLAALARLEAEIIEVDRHDELFSEGDRDTSCYVVLDGWVACYKLLEDGRRQIINFMIAGDFLGLRSLLLQVSDHSATALTRLRLSVFSGEQLREIFADHPRVATAVFWAISRDEAIVVEHLVNLGRRKALERLAHFIIELGARLKLVGLATDDEYHCPLRQEEFADVLGLTAIHINRSFRLLREQQLAVFHRHRIVIHDRRRLIELAQYNDFHLAPPGSPM